MRALMVWLALGITSLSTPCPIVAQDPDVASEQALRLSVDCSRCDLDHIRREIDFVDHVRTQEDADVHVLITTQRTGAFGTQFTLLFIGRQAFTGLVDGLTYVSSPTDTDAEVRDGLNSILKLGLMRYIARTPFARGVQISYRARPGERAPAQAGLTTSAVSDPWNFWTFRTSVSGSMRAEQRQRAVSAWGSLSASRTTETWKIALRLRGNYSESQFDIDDTTTVTSTREFYGAEGLLVRSVGDHWGVGLQQSARSSSFANIDLGLRLGPAVEYNIFPYSESTRRQLRILYSMGVNEFNYIEETIFDKTSQTLFDARLAVSLDVTETWGNALVGIEASQFLGQSGKNRLTLSSVLDFRVFRGFGISLSGGLSRIRDQLNLPKGDATPEEILLRQRELVTDFQVRLSVGFTYTFGSIYSNVVNPRFGG